jgi:hypothetical protein
MEIEGALVACVSEERNNGMPWHGVQVIRGLRVRAKDRWSVEFKWTVRHVAGEVTSAESKGLFSLLQPLF